MTEDDKASPEQPLSWFMFCLGGVWTILKNEERNPSFNERFWFNFNLCQNSRLMGRGSNELNYLVSKIFRMIHLYVFKIFVVRGSPRSLHWLKKSVIMVPTTVNKFRAQPKEHCWAVRLTMLTCCYKKGHFNASTCNQYFFQEKEEKDWFLSEILRWHHMKFQQKLSSTMHWRLH